MKKIQTIWNTTRKFKYRVFLVLIAIIALIYIFVDTSIENVEEEAVLQVVTVATAGQLSGSHDISVIGTVRAFSEAMVTSETSGRVTNVSATLGQTVPAGYVIASLENASQRAAALQAEGVYEAALASAEQSDVSLDEANNSLRSAKNDVIANVVASYNTVNAAIKNDVDVFFANPNSKIPGVKINSNGQASFLNNERVSYQTLLTDWQNETNNLNQDSDLDLATANALTRVDRTIALVDVFISIFNSDDTDQSYTDFELNTLSTTFTNLRATLQTTKNNLNDSVTTLENAKDAVRRAEIGAAGSVSSAADAQVKQALGSLRAAQANLAKTILRTPISGTVNSLNVRVGDFVGNQTIIARVANNNALEIVTFVGDNEKSAFKVGNAVIVEENYEGIVSEVAPAVDPVTKKIEVRIAIETEAIQNGDTVTISAADTKTEDPNKDVVIPLSAVKFEIENGYIFKVENGKLVSKEVELGVIRGSSVEIISGLSLTDEFVLDARGLLSDTKVQVNRN